MYVYIYIVYVFSDSHKCPPLLCCDVAVEKQEKEVDIYANLSDEKAFVFSVALAEINRKILGQRLLL